MSYHTMGRAALDYAPCYYEGSRICFRGPKAHLDEPYVAYLGSTETFGKFVSQPFPWITGLGLHTDTLNLGVVNSGIDMYLAEPDLMELARRSKVTVVQTMSAANLSNKYYTVHPRRNDRFVKPTIHLEALVPDLDLTEVHFTRHFLTELAAHSPSVFEIVRKELRAVWIYRMEQLLAQIGGKIVLLWFGRRSPDAASGMESLAIDPLFVDRAMIEMLRPMVNEIVEVVPSDMAKAEGPRGMVFHPLEAEAATKMMSVRAHCEAAERLRQSLIPLTVL